MNERQPGRWPLGTLALVVGGALLAGVAAGAGLLYVRGPGSGNETAAACPAKADLAAALDAAAKGEVAAVRPLETPFDASRIAFADENGRAMTLAQFRGTSLLVNLWATWCVPCRQEMPALEALEKAEGGEDFAVVPINVDLGSPDKPKAFYAETNLTALPFYRDDTMGVFNDLKREGVALGLPVSLLVDGEGCVRAAINGPAEWASPDAVALIGALRRGAGV